MYDLSTKSVVVDFSSKSSGWYDSVDLQRFNAAGNEISEVDERMVAEFGAIKHFDVFPRCILLNERCIPISCPRCLPDSSLLRFLEH